MKMVQEEEMLIQSKMFEILQKLGISEMEYQKNAQYHGSDQMKSMQIVQMQQQTQTLEKQDSAPKLDR